MRPALRRAARTLIALTLGAGILAACAGGDSPTKPSNGTGGGNPGVQPAPTTPGAIALAIVGLPFGVSADLTITGPGGFSKVVTNASTLAELTPGRYTISARAVRTSAGVFAPSSATQIIDVGGGPPTNATVTYAALAAVIDVTISGLPQGVAAKVSLTPPGGGEVPIAATQRVDPAAAGRWQLLAQNVGSGGYTYAPTPATRDLDVVSGDTVKVPVVYALSTGAIAVSVTGLPASATAPITVTGPDGAARVLNGTATLTDLAPGVYTVAAGPLGVGGLAWVPVTPSQQVTVVASIVATPAIVAYRTPVGRLAISSTGLPIGTKATFSLAGSVVTRSVVGDATVDSLPPGSYTVTTSSLSANGNTYAPIPPTIVVAVTDGTTSNARFAFGPTTGGLSVSLSGLPDGASATISISGPDGFTRALSASATLTNLTPGKYTISAPTVRGSFGVFVATPASQDVTVSAGGVVVPATVAYAPLPSVVEVTVLGLPGGSTPSVTLTAPTGQDIAVTALTTRIANATAGSWRLVAAGVTVGGYVYSAAPATQTQSVALSDTLRFSVQYTLTSGALAIAVTGLPSGAGGLLSVTGPGNFVRSVTTTTTLVGLTPGTYTVTASSVTVLGLPYAANPPSQTVTVSASLSATPATVNYAVPGGRIAFNLTGLPSGASPNFLLTGTSGTQTISGSATLDVVAAGTYSMHASVFTYNGTTYTPTPATVSLTVSIGQTSVATFSYAGSGGTTGRLAFNVSGLPQGTTPTFTLAGSGGGTSLSGTSTVDPIAAGTYTLTANTVTSGTSTYTPTPATQSITISVGATSTANITYSGGGGSGGGFNVSVDNVYLTQATQRLDGTVALVANRDALLRVFVTANTANIARPDVRVRIYDGASLLQTTTLTAPEVGVRTSIAEGTLTSTWNTVVPAVNVRTTMKVLVDVDPSSTLSEANRTDNIWPRGGTPQSVAVSVVPAFNVRFVPVTVAGLTGNVSDANRESFLTSTRRFMPIKDVVADVRAPFTSSAPALVADDANSGWLTVLSELNALRTTDGAPNTTHYYGVVKVSYTSGIAGLGYVPGRAAIGWDYQPSNDGVAVHEWGHNFSRPHTPCGVSGDAAYPYAGGQIGVYGWNSSSNALVNSNATDVMGYCSNTWISDWTWSNVMNYRASSGFQASAFRASSSATDDGLLVWGRVVDGRVILEPSFRVRAPATAPVSGATHRVELLDAQGATLLDLPLLADRVDHEMRHEERQFAVVLPWSATLEQALTSVRVRDVRQPLATTERVSANARARAANRGAAVIDDPAADITPIGTTRSQIRWNSSAYPMALVRDANSGAIMGFVRNSGDAVVTNGRAVEVVYSDGVRSIVRR